MRYILKGKAASYYLLREGDQIGDGNIDHMRINPNENYFVDAKTGGKYQFTNAVKEYNIGGISLDMDELPPSHIALFEPYENKAD